MSFRWQEKLIIESQYAALEGIINNVQIGQRGIARDRIVRLMSEETGIASWATALRMVIENMTA